MHSPIVEPTQERVIHQDISYYKNTVIDLFSKWAQETPYQMAVKMGDESLTYKELDDLSNQLALHLRKLGIGRDSLVGVLLPRSLEMMVSVWAILKAGGAYVPMAPSDGEKRINYITQNSNLELIISLEKIDINPKCQKVFLDLKNKAWFYSNSNLDTKRKMPDFPVKIDPASLVYVIYTSGTTGWPKGALIEHRNLYSLISNYVPKLDPGDRTLQSMNTTCDSSIIEIFPTLCNGGTLVIFEKDLSKTIKKEKITFTCVTPSMTGLLNKEDCYSLKNITIAGEKLTEEAVKKIPTHVNIYNGYGPTECSVAISNTKISDPKKIHIGGVFPMVESYVVKADLSICKIGEEGELLIGGPLVGRGYLNSTKLTSEKFISNPFGKGLVYRTGDLVKWSSSTTLEFLGRIDRQVKVLGFRVELDGVEKIISKFPGVTSAHVQLKEQNLISYFTPQDIDTLKLKTYLKEQLPPYSIPSQFMALDNFPINAAGKVDELSLPEFTPTLEVIENLPITIQEKEIAGIWRKILTDLKRPISLDDNFFDLGANSLDAMKLTKLMQERFYPDFPLEQIYENPILKDFINEKRQLSTHRIKDKKTPWIEILLDGLKSIPSTLYFYISFSAPVIFLFILLFFYPLVALGLIIFELIFYRFLPDFYFLRKLKLKLAGSWYKSVKLIEEFPLEKMPRSLFAIHPHGITEDHMYLLEKQLLIKKIKYKVINHEILFKIPFLKTYHTLLNALPARESSYVKAEKKNISLVVTPGDVLEGFRAHDPGAIAMSTQKHFFKYLLKTGTPITPVFFHGNHKAFRVFTHFFQQRYNLFKKGRTQVLAPFWGRFFLPIPFKVDLLCVVGTPLMVSKIENPTWEDVDRLYKSYLEKLEEFHKNHASSGEKLSFN